MLNAVYFYLERTSVCACLIVQNIRLGIRVYIFSLKGKTEFFFDCSYPENLWDDCVVLVGGKVGLEVTTCDISNDNGLIPVLLCM